MAINTSSGYIGLGSRLFLSPEATWGTNAQVWKAYNIYNQEGSRPQKVTTPIEVSQLYPSMLRRKPIKNSVSVEGAFTFSLPTTDSAPFFELLTGDDTGGVGGIPLRSIAGHTGFVNQDGFVAFASDDLEALETVTSYVAGTGARVGDLLSIVAPKTTHSGENTAISDITTVGGTNDGTGRVIIHVTASLLSSGELVADDEVVIAGLTVTGDVTQDAVDDLNGTQTIFAIDDSAGTITLDMQLDSLGANYGAGVGQWEYLEAITNTGIVHASATITWSGVDDADLASVTGEFNIVSSYKTGVDGFVVIDVPAINLVGTLNSGEWSVKQLNYSLKEVVETSYTFVQTIGLNQISEYTGMMAQSTTINVSPDDVANIEVTFLGQDEKVYDAIPANVNTVFGSLTDQVTASDDGQIISAGANYDNCTEFYPSWSASLFVNRKDPTDLTQLQTPSGNVIGGDSWTDNVTNPTLFRQADNTKFPFSDLSITINNNLEFPAYINGTKTRNKPVQTTYKEITGSITLPYNEYTRQLVESMFDQDTFQFRIVFSLSDDDTGTGAKSITIDLPEVCILGDSLADIPAGEMTLPINFGVYASKTGTAYDNPANTSPLTISVV